MAHDHDQDLPVQHQPYVHDEARLPEFTWSAVIVGAVLGIIFGASSLYLVLKVGMTVSASIPVAVLSITLFRLFSRLFGFRRATILENNIVQTTGSAGESIAFGVGVTMPAVMLLGFEMDLTRVMVVSVLGGIVGILMMIPLRRAFIVKQHGTLKYPEGTACADVLIVGEEGGTSAKTVFTGFGLAFVYQFAMQGLRLWKEVPSRALGWFKGAEPALEASPMLLGVGYIIGTRVACIMLAGAMLSYLVFVPAIHFFGDGLEVALYPGTKLIRDMNSSDIRRAYILYIGAGAVATGGIISLCRAIPLIVSSLVAGLRDLGSAVTGGPTSRTDHDLPISFVVIGTLAVTAVIWVALPLGTAFSWVSLVGAILIVVFGFLFVTVSSRLTGEIGSSSNPISGMTVATLLLTCLIFLMLGWTSSEDRLIAITVAAVVCVASSNGGTTSQDLKTGFLVGATPKSQQWAIIVGAVSSALVIGAILMLLNDASTVYSKKDLPELKAELRPDVSTLTETGRAPGDETTYHVWRVSQAVGQEANIPRGTYLVDELGVIRYLLDPGITGQLTRRDDGSEVRKYCAPQTELMAMITDGILTQKLPWPLVLLGVFVALVLELSRVPSLPFAVGVYLPFSTSAAVFVGGLVRGLADRAKNRAAGHHTEADAEMTPGVLLSTGYIAGSAIGGVLIAFLYFSDRIPEFLARWEFRSQEVTAAMPLDEAYRTIAAQELGLAPDVHEPAGPEADQRQARIAALAKEIKTMNQKHLPGLIDVRQGTVLTLPGNAQHTVATAARLSAIAEELLGDERRAATLLELNPGVLPLPDTLPAGSALRVPQHNWPALACFGTLVAFLLLVACGGLLRAPETGLTRRRADAQEKSTAGE